MSDNLTFLFVLLAQAALLAWFRRRLPPPRPDAATQARIDERVRALAWRER